MSQIPASSPLRKQILTEITNKYSADERDDFIKAYRSEATRQISSIYIELPYLLDVYLGGLLWMTKDDPKAYQYILNRLSDYNNRIQVEHAPYFSELGITEEQLLELLKDPEQAEFRMMTAPPTTMWKDLREIHQGIVTENKMRESLNVSPVTTLTYVINTYPLVLSVEAAKKLKSRLILGLKETSINFGVISVPGHELEEKHYKEFDHWFIYHFYNWSEHPESNGAKALMDLRMVKAELFAPPRVSDPEVVKLLPTYTLDDYAILEKNSLAALNAFASFQYYRSKIILS